MLAASAVPGVPFLCYSLDVAMHQITAILYPMLGARQHLNHASYRKLLVSSIDFMFGNNSHVILRLTISYIKIGAARHFLPHKYRS
jgi:hypothetical protein